jgi:integrating conjugative element protein (TIGR03765 family)
LCRSFPLAALGLLIPMAVNAEALIVVEDRGGASALPYYQALNPQGTSVPSAPTPSLRLRNPADAESALLPVRSALLSPGIEPACAIDAPGLSPLFLVGDDERSRLWLKQKAPTLRAQRAFGWVVNVDSPEALAELRRLAPGVRLSPASGDDLARRLGIRHYPALIGNQETGNGRQETEDRGRRGIP